MVLGMESKGLPRGTTLDDLVESDKGSAADEEDVLRVELDVFLMGMLAPSLGWNVAGGGIEDLQ